MASSSNADLQTAFAGNIDSKPTTPDAETPQESDRLHVTVDYRTGRDPYVAAVSDDAYMPPHHVLTLASKATRLGQSVYHTGTKSLAQGETDKTSTKSVVSVRMPRWMRDFAARRTHQQSIVPLLSFQNPWQSFKKPGLSSAIHGGLKWGLPAGYVEGGSHQSRYRSRGKHSRHMKAEQEKKMFDVRVVKPEWSQRSDHNSSVRVTWLGHATTLVQFPNGMNVLFDPIFVDRASPTQNAGPIRFTPAPCQVDELPRIDIVCISHNHYDHLSWDCMRKLRKKERKRGDGGMRVFCPLGNVGFFREAGFKKDSVVEMDWWDQAEVEPNLPTSDLNAQNNPSSDNTEQVEQKTEALTSADGSLTIVCTPAQHGSGRGGGDQGISLWSSWLLIYHSNSPSRDTRVFFAGDTGLRSHIHSRRARSEFPTCPVFRDISLHYGVPQLLLLPISVGSSLSYFRSWDPFPRRFSPFPRVEASMTSAIHMDAEDAAECHRIMALCDDTSDEGQRISQEGPSVTSLAVHFGTFVRNEEQTRADVRLLQKACLQRGIRFLRPDIDGSISGRKSTHEKDRGQFVVSHQGETLRIPL